MIVVQNVETYKQPGQSKLTLKVAFMAVMALTFICFVPDLKNGLLDWDDSGYVLYNEQIRSLSFETIRWAFTTFYCNYWAPLTWLSLAVDYAFSGLNPLGYHLTNNFIHASNSGLFLLVSHQLLLLRRGVSNFDGGAWLSVAKSSDASILFCSMLAAVIFAIHPLRVESVAWVTERKDVLSMFFGLLAIFAYLQHAYSSSRTSGLRVPRPSFFLSSKYYWVTVFFFTLSLLSKAMFVTLPVMLLVLDWFPLKRLSKNYVVGALFEKIPLLLLAGFASVLTFQATAVTRDSYFGVTLSSQVLIVFKSLFTYLRLFIWPVDISTVYFNPGNISVDYLSVISILIFLAISCYCLIMVRVKPFFLVSWLMFLIPLFPVLSVSGIHQMAPRFTYLPGLSVSFTMAVGLFAVLEACNSSRYKRIFVKSVIVATLIWFACITIRDIGFWKSDVTLWSRVIELEPHKFGKAYFQRSLFLNLDGEYQKALVDVNEALAIALQKKYPGIYEIYGQRAAILKNMKNYEGALADLNRAVETSNIMFKGKYYKERGELYTKLGNHEKAAEDFAAANIVTNVN